jgi:hypothetical protein
MKHIEFLLAIILSTFLLHSCSENDEIDTEKPSIDLSIEDAFPINCDTLYFGEYFEFSALFSDNVELGSFSIDIHNNFDHHSHSTEVTACDLDPIKDPINPFLFIEDYSIPDGLDVYKTEQSIIIASSNESGVYDEGDYHFFISLTDKEGWSAQKGLSIKILHR